MVRLERMWVTEVSDYRVYTMHCIGASLLYIYIVYIVVYILFTCTAG